MSSSYGSYPPSAHTTITTTTTPSNTLTPPLVNSQLLVYHLDIFVASILCLVILLRLPRGLGRFWRTYEWSDGHFLGYARVRESNKSSLNHSASKSSPHGLVRDAPKASKASNNSRRGGGNSGDDAAEKGHVETDESHTLHNPTTLAHYATAQRFNFQPSYPPHIAACPSPFRRLADILSISLVRPYSNFQILVMVLYFVALFYAYTYKSHVFTEPKRVAWVAVSQLPFVFLFAAKNNVLAWLIGVGYHHLNYLHRFLGWLVVIGANIHAIGYFFKWSLNGTMSKNIKRPTNIWGIVALISFDLIVLFSLSLFRTWAYNVFLTVHFLGYVVAVPAIYFHFPSTLPFLIALCIPYCIDYTFRFLKTRVVTATLRPLPSLGATRIEIPALNSGWRPGQHVRIRILSSSLGWFRWAESHPFSIASPPVASKIDGVSIDERGLVLICKKTGTWTQKVFNLAMGGSYGDMEGAAGKKVKVLIEGPYGGPGHAIFSSYSAVVMIVGGSGISFGMSVVQDLVQKDLQALSRVKSIQLIWMVQSPDALTPMIPLFTALVASCPTLSVTIYYTRPFCPKSTRSNSEGSDKNDPSDKSPSLPKVPHGVPITMHAGRPSKIELIRAIESGIAHAVSTGSNASGHGSVLDDERGINGVLVGVCGPPGLGNEVNSAVAGLDRERKRQVGGVEVFEEVFGL